MFKFQCYWFSKVLAKFPDWSSCGFLESITRLVILYEVYCPHVLAVVVFRFVPHNFVAWLCLGYVLYAFRKLVVLDRSFAYELQISSKSEYLCHTVARQNAIWSFKRLYSNNKDLYYILLDPAFKIVAKVESINSLTAVNLCWGSKRHLRFHWKARLKFQGYHYSKAVSWSWGEIHPQ